MKEDERKYLRVLTAAGAREILNFLNERGTGQYKEMVKFVTISTLNERLRELLNMGLIRHHLEKSETRVEWYEATEKGKKVMEHLNSIAELLES